MKPIHSWGSVRLRELPWGIKFKSLCDSSISIPGTPCPWACPSARLQQRHLDSQAVVHAAKIMKEDAPAPQHGTGNPENSVAFVAGTAPYVQPTGTRRPPSRHQTCPRFPPIIKLVAWAPGPRSPPRCAVQHTARPPGNPHSRACCRTPWRRLPAGRDKQLHTSGRHWGRQP